MVFLAMTVLGWLRFGAKGKWFWYGMALFLFALALASKTSVVMLPVLLLGLCWWQRGRITVRDVLLSVPFFILSAGMAAMTVFAQGRYLDVLTQPLQGIYRLAGAGWVVWFYLYKALLPINLSMIYPHWKPTIESLGWISFGPTLAIACLAVLLWIKRKNIWARAMLFAFGCFVVALLPVMGFLNMSITMHSLVADHFQYISIVAVIALVCATGWKLAQHKPQVRVPLCALAVCILVALGMETWKRAETISTKETLWRDTLSKNPKAWMGQYNLATTLTLTGQQIIQRGEALLAEAQSLFKRAQALAAQGKQAEAESYRQAAHAKKLQSDADFRKTRKLRLEAIPHYRKAIEIQPFYIRPYNNYGLVLTELGRIDEGIELYRKGIKADADHDPHKTNPVLFTNLGLAYLRKDNLAKAEAAFKEAYRLEPRDAAAFGSLLRILMSQNRNEEVVELLTRHIQSYPQDTGSLHDLAIVLRSQGKRKQAAHYLRRALKLDPNDPQLRMTHGDFLVRANRPREAIESYQRALLARRERNGPDEFTLRLKLAIAQDKTGQNAVAMTSLVLLLQNAPNSANVRNALVSLMNKIGHTGEAAICYERAILAVPGWIEGLQKLAWIRATHPDSAVRNSNQSMVCIRQLQSRVPKPGAIILDTYSAVLAEMGKFPQAVSAAKAALERAKKARNEDLARQIEDRIKLYETGRPYRESN